MSYQFSAARNKFPELGNADVNVIIWTTTPWTLPASLAIVVHPNFEYSLMEAGDKVYLIAADLKDEVSNATGITFGRELLRVKGRLVGRFEGSSPIL